MAATQTHTPVIIDGVRAFFPFEPYEVQRNYMRKVIQAIKSGKNALLESPTGTGKTLSLVCSTLGWLTSQGRTDTLIFYTSRTHKQLSQAAKEMKRTAYSKNPAVVIGSKAKLCINSEVRNSSKIENLIDRTCRNAIAKNACAYYTNYEQKIETMNVDTVNDIEDLMDFGNRHQCCPYYAARKIAEVKATVVFMPYNYLFEPKLRKSLPLKLKNSVIIFDEGHNIQSQLRECISASVKVSCLKTVIESCLELPGKLSAAMNKERFGLSRSGYDPESRRGGIVNELNTKKSSKKDEEPKVSFMEELAEKLTTEKLQQVRSAADCLKLEIEREVTKSSYCETDLFYNYLRASGIEYSTSDPIITTLDSMISFWSTAGVMNPDKVARFVTALTNLSEMISALYPSTCFRLQLLESHKKELVTHFKGYCKTILDPNTPLDRGGKILDIELNIWCLNPAIGLQRTFTPDSMPRTMIFTSGTLSPMESMARALNFQPGTFVMEGFSHVINDSQMKMMILEKAPNSYSLSGKFEDAERPEYAMALGKTMMLLFELLPYGTLVFFPSYNRMKRMVDTWKYRFIWREMEKRAKLFVEPTGTEECERLVDNYKKTIASTDINNNRAVFFGVCRGKLSEGTNLEGDQCRTVIIAGLPYPNMQDPRVKAIRAYRDIHKNPNGSMWYEQQMRLALYQTVGRAIRSRTDYGLVLLCDPRFHVCKQGTPQWMEKYYPNEGTPFDQLEVEIKSFFLSHNQAISGSITKLAKPAPQPQSQAVSIDATARLRDMVEGYKAAKRIRLSQKSPSQENGDLENSTSTDGIQEDAIQQTDPTVQQTAPAVPMVAGDILSQENINQDNQSQQVPVATESASVGSRAKSLNIFKKKKNESTDKDIAKTTSRSSCSASNYSILNRPVDINAPASYKCYICYNPAQDPHRTECPCAHAGCKNCLMILQGKRCGRCKTLVTSLKKLYFRSAHRKVEKV